MGPCMCGDECCPWCGPAQGNNRCEMCGAWESDGGCNDPAKCAKKSLEMEIQMIEEIDLETEMAEDIAEALREEI